FAGDAEKPEEKMLMELYGDRLGSFKSDILKIGHHGSKTSTSDEFLSTVSPEAAVISVGLNNRYGHPSKAVLDLLAGDKIHVFRTDKNGAVVAAAKKKRIKIAVSLK
ncbi:MAG: hypothetical protein LBI03_04345, partial [Clostridiales bacterium]|nr:hypothetical protein [Clostridiales bacterium]